MKLFIPYVELESDEQGSPEYIGFQKLIAMMAALDHYLRPNDAIAFEKSLNKSLQNTGIANTFDQQAYVALEQRTKYQLIILERFIGPIMKSAGLDEQNQIANSVIFNATYHHDGWLMDIGFNNNGNHWAKLYRETQ